jgi:type II restriction/modification system DNA methylase subunit YeeA
VVVANPPYLGNMNDRLKKFAQYDYPESKTDLFAMFIERNLDLAATGGFVAMITMQSWMFLSSYEKLRAKLLDQNTIRSMAHLGARAFDTIGGEVVSTTAFVLQNSHLPDAQGDFLRLVDGRSEAEKAAATGEAIQNPDCGWFYRATAVDFKKIPGSPIAYWISNQVRKIFKSFPPLSDVAKPRQGLATSDNDRFLRFWYEPNWSNIGFSISSRQESVTSFKKWFPCQKGGSYRKWYGNHDYLINWFNDGEEMIALAAEKYRSPTRTIKNMAFYFREGVTWSTISSHAFSMRYSPKGFISETKGAICFADSKPVLLHILGLSNTKLVDHFLGATSPTLDFHEGPVSRLPILKQYEQETLLMVENCVRRTKSDWDSYETSWDFRTFPLLEARQIGTTLSATYAALRQQWQAATLEVQRLEEDNNRLFIEAYGLQDELTPDVPLAEITLTCNPHYRYSNQYSVNSEQLKLMIDNWPLLTENWPQGEEGLELRLLADTMGEFISYAIGCMFGRYSLDKPGLILANQGETINDYLHKVAPSTVSFRRVFEEESFTSTGSRDSSEDLGMTNFGGVSFLPDRDNVIPMLDGDWFADDISERFKLFLRVTFGEKHYADNLAFIEAAIGRDIRSYFLRDFYDHHVKMYKKRPIYWLFSSPKGSFNALIYMHRYRPDTVSIVLNDYLREFRAKLTARQAHLEQVSISAPASTREKTQALKEIDRVAKILHELRDYEDDILYPLATRQVQIDLDDGVKVNYNKFGRALKRVPGLSE